MRNTSGIRCDGRKRSDIGWPNGMLCCILTPGLICIMIRDELGRGDYEIFQGIADLSKKFTLLEMD